MNIHQQIIKEVQVAMDIESHIIDTIENKEVIEYYNNTTETDIELIKALTNVMKLMKVSGKKEHMHK